ncbi:hypothetical protein G4B88_001860 [Cannabis sativa]|uniref:Uncharacterized protein n=1 Tax=Cannabis sativa TaxID=3483 RepID=A0A7J6I2N8_CANSA|nr:hypothetical protein G4B88_001860 [Cannabis sativa]
MISVPISQLRFAFFISRLKIDSMIWDMAGQERFQSLGFEAVAAPDFFSLEDSTVEHFYLPVPDSHACSRGARPKILAHEDERRLESSWFHDNIKDKSHMIQLHKYTTGARIVVLLEY